MNSSIVHVILRLIVRTNYEYEYECRVDFPGNLSPPGAAHRPSITDAALLTVTQGRTMETFPLSYIPGLASHYRES